MANLYQYIPNMSEEALDTSYSQSIHGIIGIRGRKGGKYLCSNIPKGEVALAPDDGSPLLTPEYHLLLKTATKAEQSVTNMKLAIGTKKQI